jgi:hypothetical protein
MKTLLFTFISSLLFITAAAQTRIQGTVIDAVTREALPLASISIKDTLQDKVFIAVEADEKGNFMLKFSEDPSTVVLTVRYLGYAVFTQEISNNNKPLIIALQPISNQLEGVVVNSKKRAVTINGDKVIFSIDKLGIGDGNNGLETMRQIAGIRLDKDDNIQFRGSSDVQIMINGKKSLLQGDALREFIRSLKGSDIQSVEIIAQPSARYDASGTTGIINIVLKKNRAGGFSGNVYSSVGYGEYFKSNNGGQLYYNDPLWSINANGSYYDGKSVNHRQVKQTIQLAQGIRKLEQYNEWLPTTISKDLNIGIERKLTDKQLISTQWQYDKSDEWADTFGTTNEYLNGAPVNVVRLTQRLDNPTERLTGNVFYNFTADSTVTKLDAQINYAHYKSNHEGFQRNDYNTTSFMQLDGINKTTYNIINMQADLNQRISKKIDIEGGIKYSYVEMNYFNKYSTNNPSQLIIPENLLNNDFVYKENLASAYTQFSINLDKWSVLAGLRAEFYEYDATSRTNKQTNKDSYINWFPSLSINYKKEDNQYQLSYSRRIGRPAYLALNPYYNYIDAYTLDRGNPDLKPQLYHSFQLSYIYKSAFNLSLYGYLYNKGFTTVIDYLEAENYNITYQANASKGNRFGISATLPYEPFEWWTMQLSIDGSSTYEKSEIPGFSYNGSGFGYDISLFENFKLKQDWNIVLNGYYSGRADTPSGYSRATYDFSLSVKKYMLDKKLMLTTGCSNILKKNLYNEVTQVENVKTEWINKWETRRFYFQATYYFGGGKAKKVKSTSLGDENERI